MALHVESLDNPVTRYNCLSYVWGSENATECVRVDAEGLQITANLLICLRYLRHPQHALVLWIDAICINQKDLDEKSHQIALMKDIYSQCSMAYLWLGAPLDPTSVQHDPFKIFQHFADNKHFFELPGFSTNNSAQIRFEEDEEFDALWNGFLAVAHSPWWTRAWTVQEAVLPRKSVLCYGNWRLDFDTLSIGRRRRNDHLASKTQCCAGSQQAFPVSKGAVFNPFLTQVERVEKYRQANLPKEHPLSWKDQVRTFPDFDYSPFYELVVTFSNRRCKEPQDKLFSLLAMAKSSKLSGLRPDYSLTITDTYTRIFQLILEETDNDYRCMIGPNFGSSNPELPSWVPDFSQAAQQKVLRRILLSSLFKASNREVGGPKCQHGQRLSVTGLRVDTVITIGSMLDSLHVPPARLRDIMAEWREILKRLSAHQHKPHSGGPNTFVLKHF
ncbi:heterokaryon incompatibility protein-domain-containing protein [Nemania abortiva]|nr:heterokaryon incompatibility protein-domain-containing protein [Nemania abortiva]